eukprot:m.76479 g.76479  ORF g.76479 m.76479 type:complete len:315 (-) comp19036_c0_seq2:188-1132(-)
MRQRAEFLFELGISICVHQGDGNRSNTGSIPVCGKKRTRKDTKESPHGCENAINFARHCGQRGGRGLARSLEISTCRIEIEWCEDSAVHGVPSVHFHHSLVEQLGQTDVQRKDVWSSLVANSQHILEPSICDKEHAIALPFQKRVCCDCSPHLDCVDLVSWNWVRVLESHKRADTVQCRIFIDFGVLGEHLGRGERAIWFETDDVCEGAPSIDAKFVLAVSIPNCGCGRHRIPCGCSVPRTDATDRSWRGTSYSAGSGPKRVCGKKTSWHPSGGTCNPSHSNPPLDQRRRNTVPHRSPPPTVSRPHHHAQWHHD